MKYYTANIMSSTTLEEASTIINKTLKSNDTLIMLGQAESTIKVVQLYLQQKCNCQIAYIIDSYDKLIQDKAFDINVRVSCSYMPTNENIDDYADIQLYGLEPKNTQFTQPTQFSVDWAIWGSPVSLENILSKKFGYHSNPYTGYVEYVRDYTNAYNDFIKEFNKEIWANV